MLHLGDITKISGYTAPVVDCIIGGSPCQDLSVAGKRQGLDGERSGLYIEQVRIVKEMRERDERNGRSGVDIRPRYMVWENVPGAFSSNKGEDFRIVLEELAKVKDKDAVIPMPDKGKWENYGCIMGDGWSIAWRVLDAQFWGVPQRRRRIALVADFGGQSAPEILFVRQSLSGNIDPSEPKRKETPSDASRGIGANDCFSFEPGIASREGGHIYENVSGTLRANAGDNQMATAYGISSYNSNAMKSNNPHSGIYEADTSSTLDGNGGNPSCNQGGIAIVEPVPYTLKIRGGVSVDSYGKAAGKGALIQENLSATLGVSQDQYLFQPVFSVENHPNDSRVGINEDGKVQALTSRMGTGGGNVPMVMQQCYSKQKRAQSATDHETWVESETANTLNAFDVGDVRTTEAVVYALDRASFNQGKNAQYDFEISDKGINSPLVAKGPGAVCYGVTAKGNGDCFISEERHTALSTGGGQAGQGYPCVLTAQEEDRGEKFARMVYESVYLKEFEEDTDRVGQEPVCFDEFFDNEWEDAEIRQYYIKHFLRVKPMGINGDKAGTLDASYYKGCGMRQGVERDVVAIPVQKRYIVRRLTPLECERLQGYPDGWTDIGEWVDSNGKKRQTSDAARYKALGNSIALPPWKWVLKRLCACYERDATMASLFDGIGGFPYLWEQLNGKGTCLWASEIEEFPIAVTKVRIGGNT